MVLVFSGSHDSAKSSSIAQLINLIQRWCILLDDLLIFILIHIFAISPYFSGVLPLFRSPLKRKKGAPKGGGVIPLRFMTPEVCFRGGGYIFISTQPVPEGS